MGCSSSRLEFGFGLATCRSAAASFAVIASSGEKEVDALHVK